MTKMKDATPKPKRMYASIWRTTGEYDLVNNSRKESQWYIDRYKLRQSMKVVSGTFVPDKPKKGKKP